ncbi:MAG: diguanylate cyclase [Bacillota bacterium]|nr:diguanylate cyclase [Bacillota bacterium]
MSLRKKTLLILAVALVALVAILSAIFTYLLPGPAGVEAPRRLYQQGFMRTNVAFAILVLAGLLSINAVACFLERDILSRVARLTQAVYQVVATGDLSVRVPTDGKDEFSRLREAINAMLTALQHSIRLRGNEGNCNTLVNELCIAQQQLLDIIEFLPDATFVVGRDGKVIAWNKAMEEMTGVRKEDIINKGDYAYGAALYGTPRPCIVDLLACPPEYLADLGYKDVHKRGTTLYTEMFLPSLYGGRGAFVGVAASPLLDGEGNIVGGIESWRDLTERKQAEQQLEYLRFYDPITGLRNRSCFEGELQRAISAGARIGLILCDVDGLRLVNRAAGHLAGDALLLATAGILRETFGATGVLARIGDDEFAVLMRDADEVTLREGCLQLRRAVDRYNACGAEPQLILSIGCAIRHDGAGGAVDLVQQATAAIYREKMASDYSLLGAAFRCFTKALSTLDGLPEGSEEQLETAVRQLLEEDLWGKNVQHATSEREIAPRVYGRCCSLLTPKGRFQALPVEEVEARIVGRQLTAVDVCGPDGIIRAREMVGQAAGGLLIPRQTVWRMTLAISEALIQGLRLVDTARLRLVENGDTLFVALHLPGSVSSLLLLSGEMLRHLASEVIWDTTGDTLVLRFNLPPVAIKRQSLEATERSSGVVGE